MKTPWELRTEAFKQLQVKFSCDHGTTRLCVRTVAGGGSQYVEQCKRCGHPTTSPIKKADALSRNEGKAIPPFDQALLEQWDRDKNSAYNVVDSEYQRRLNAMSSVVEQAVDDWDILYRDYLASSSWQQKRRLVIERSVGLCEGCRSAKPTEVHHRSYENVGEEFLFELVALCHDCHEAVHERRKRRRAEREQEQASSQS